MDNAPSPQQDQTARVELPTTTTPVPLRERGAERVFRAVERTLALLANLAVVLGIAFAVYQLGLAERAEERRIAIEAIDVTRSPEFLRAFRQLKGAAMVDSNAARDKEATVDNINYVMNVYDNIALLYMNRVADRCIIKRTVQEGVRDMGTIATALSYPSELRGNFDLLLALMNSQECETRIP